MSHTPCRHFVDMHDDEVSLSVEANSDTGVWLCARNKGTDRTVAVDLSDSDAAVLGTFLLGLHS